MKERIPIQLFFLVISLMSTVAPARAQDSREKLSLTLEKARALAMEKNPVLAEGLVKQAMDKEALAEARIKRLPQIYADYNLQRNLIIPVTPVPANAFDPSAPEGELRPLRFTTKWTSNAGVTGSLDLFNPQKRGAVKEAAIQEKITQLENSNTAVDISFETGSAYLAALIAEEQLRLAITDTVSKATLLITSQQQWEEGRLLTSALNQVKADRNNALNDLEEAIRIYQNSIARLLYFMGHEPDANIEIDFEDDLESLFIAFQSAPPADSVSGFSYNRYRQNEALLSTQIQTAVSSYLPSLTLKGYYGSNYYDNDFEIFKSTNWNGNSFVNLGLKLPLTESLEKRKAVRRLRLQRQANELNYQNERNKNHLDYLEAVGEAATYEKRYARAFENFQLAEQNLRIAEQQFSNGRLLITELNQVSYNYQLEKNNYLNTVYNYILSKLRVEKLNRQ